MTGAGLTQAIFSGCRPRALAALLRTFRNIDLAEDLYQEACLKGAERWPRDGVPNDPQAWLIRVARNAGIDRVRRDARLVREKPEEILERAVPSGDIEVETVEAIDRAECKDDVLRLMFMCCVPSLKTHEQLALALKVIVGFSVEEIASAFLVTPDTMQRRISRAKQRAAAVKTPLETPDMAERAERLKQVQTLVYLLFNEGYAASGGELHIKSALCDEAIRLARLLLELFPGQPELMGLLALCLLQHSRRKARLDDAGNLVPLENQDRSLWNRSEIAEGRVILEKALRKGQPGTLQVQAAIAAVHCSADDAEETNWTEIAALYGALEAFEPSPVVRLNRAVALAKVSGAETGLSLLQEVAEPLSTYRPFHSVRGGLLEEVGDITGALEAMRRASSLSPTRAEAAYLQRKIVELEEKSAVMSETGSPERP